MDENPSRRVVHQRLRNRIIEAVHTLAEGDDGVRAVWPTEYFETFDLMPHHEDGNMLPNSALTPEECSLLAEVSAILDEASDATPGRMTADELIATGWPARVKPVASERSPQCWRGAALMKKGKRKRPR